MIKDRCIKVYCCCCYFQRVGGGADCVVFNLKKKNLQMLACLEVHIEEKNIFPETIKYMPGYNFPVCFIISKKMFYLFYLKHRTK